MSKWKILSSAAVFALALAPAAHADDFTKLTLLTFSGPVDVPGITLPAGTYRFELADPTTGRRVIRVSDKDGTKTYGMFLSISNERMTPSDKPVVMFKETAAGAPPAVQVWFYPGETYGYEFAYPHDQALKIAKATHQPVLAYNQHTDSTTSDADRLSSMKSAEVSRIDENDKPVSADETLKESSKPRASAATTSDSSSQRSSATTASPAAPASTTASSTASTAQRTAPAAPAPTTVGTSGTTSDAPAAHPARKHLPRTASPLPLLALLSGVMFAAALGVRAARQSL
jgi:hypothetical protein